MRLLTFAVGLALASLGAADTPSEAERAYVKGDFATAAEKWQDEVRSDGPTAGLLAALGNAEWKLGRKGRAMVCWERALLLDPRDAVALAGVRHAQNAGGTERPAPNWYETYSIVLGADTWLILATASFWTGLLCFLLPRLSRQPANEWNQRGRVAAVTLFVLCLPGLWGAHTQAARAVVRTHEVALRLTPTALGEPMVLATEGDVVRTGRPFNGHIRITTATGKTGWVRSNEIESIWGGGLPMDLDSKVAP